MCDIGKPVEMIVVEPLKVPAPVPGTVIEPEPVVPTFVEVPITVEEETLLDTQVAYIQPE